MGSVVSHVDAPFSDASQKLLDYQPAFVSTGMVAEDGAYFNNLVPPRPKVAQLSTSRCILGIPDVLNCFWELLDKGDCRYGIDGHSQEAPSCERTDSPFTKRGVLSQ